MKWLCDIANEIKNDAFRRRFFVLGKNRLIVAEQGDYQWGKALFAWQRGNEKRGLVRCRGIEVTH